MSDVDWASMVTVGRIIRPHGRRGEVVVESETDFASERFAPGAVLCWMRSPAEVQPVRIASSRPYDARWVVGLEAADQLGRLLAARGLGVVYGGGRVGLMGRLADAAMAAGAEVIGVIPDALQGREIGHHGITELIRVRNMHERKAKMAELADAFIVLPGGLGTLEETFEANGDDCDGLELLSYNFLRDLGFAETEVYRAIVYRRSDGQHHMVTLWFEQPEDPWVIDPTGAMTSGMPRMSEVPGWAPLKVFSETEEFTVEQLRSAAR